MQFSWPIVAECLIIVALPTCRCSLPVRWLVWWLAPMVTCPTQRLSLKKHMKRQQNLNNTKWIQYTVVTKRWWWRWCPTWVVYLAVLWKQSRTASSVAAEKCRCTLSKYVHKFKYIYIRTPIHIGECVCIWTSQRSETHRLAIFALNVAAGCWISLLLSADKCTKIDESLSIIRSLRTHKVLTNICTCLEIWFRDRVGEM